MPHKKRRKKVMTKILTNESTGIRKSWKRNAFMAYQGYNKESHDPESHSWLERKAKRKSWQRNQLMNKLEYVTHDKESNLWLVKE